jgi:uncharacterized membrane protein YgcG
MKRRLAPLSAAVLALLVTLGFSSTSPAQAGVDDFTFDSMSVTYELSRTSSGEAEMRVVETLVAQFPDTDQNHGIIRAIPTSSHDRPINLDLVGVTDGEGNARDFTTNETGGFLEVTVAAPDFVHGVQTYVFEYREHNVIFEPSGGGAAQEFYWDVNGTGWAQPFASVSGTVIIPADLVDTLTGERACYQGAEGSDTPCTLNSSTTDDAGATVLTFGATNLGPYENLTLAVGFAADTFVMPSTDMFTDISGWIFWLSVLLFLGALVAALILRLTYWRNHGGRGIIIPEFAADPEMTPLRAANLMGKKRRAFSAALIDAAVRGLVMISPADESGRSKRGFIIERTSKTASDADAELLIAFFGEDVAAGSQVSTLTPDTARYRRLAKLQREVDRQTMASGLRVYKGTELRAVLIAATIVGAIAMGWSSLQLMGLGLGGAIPPLSIGLFWLCVVPGILILRKVTPLTEQGALERDKLLGLRDYIRLAEKDRLRVLQSPQGALRKPVAVGNPKTMLALTEHVLPYAIIFGLSQEWSAVLSNLYQQESQTPGWYTGSNPADALIFSGFVTAFSTSVASSWASSDGSSSFGGSSGGGFSGGGGGGGGGGGD